jgi:hypothetical protein
MTVDTLATFSQPDSQAHVVTHIDARLESLVERPSVSPLIGNARRRGGRSARLVAVWVVARVWNPGPFPGSGAGLLMTGAPPLRLRPSQGPGAGGRRFWRQSRRSKPPGGRHSTCVAPRCEAEVAVRDASRSISRRGEGPGTLPSPRRQQIQRCSWHGPPQHPARIGSSASTDDDRALQLAQGCYLTRMPRPLP